MEHIKDKQENFAAQFLLDAHSMGWMRNKGDFNNAKYHTRQTVNFAKDILLNFEGTQEEKAEFMDKILVDLEKFKVNEEN